ncbi:efflux RND transporter permease subunit [Methylovulum psychrotolerans]|uniref:efflux RND transporter permease subunit n=1 Tax=Methylovulum psychrotolerans TaxID=1704499 RepID=UPI001BFF0182|nr:efflux RND transporter permease subunit [Methylovulum psychrotolerans]MBT9100300.1 efflux RND transporter permease subunit [Methylovulum psychrotolerans]
MWLTRLYDNPVLANLAYSLVLILGVLAYMQLPKEKAPDANLNIIEISIPLPGASTEDVERLAIDPIERMLRSKIKDIEHVFSNAQSGAGQVTVVFQDIKRPLYERRLLDVRRELQALAQTELPKDTVPDVIEVNSTNPDWFKVLVYGPGEDDNFRRQARQVQRDLQRLPGVLRVDTKGLEDPELHVVFHPERLAGLGIDPTALADTVRAYFRDLAAGMVEVDGREWLVRVTGTDNAAAQLAALPIIAAQGTVKLGDLADISRTSKKVKLGARFRDQTAVVVMPMKQPGANTLDVIDSINAYIGQRNRLSAATGVKLFLLIDTSDAIRDALAVMEGHTWSGMALVGAVTWLMLGTRLALLTTLAVPFALSGVFIALQLSGQSLNLSVLLGVVIVLGMLVDDAVVVIEAIGQYLRRGLAPLVATVAALREVWLPVATSSLTTIASFMPLMLVGGIFGTVMGVVPQVVCGALLISLVQALWILPTHAAATVKLGAEAWWRERLRRRLQKHYTLLLLRVLRRPGRALLAVAAIFLLAGAALGLGWVRFDFFPEEPNYGFVVTLEMPNGTPSARTLDKLTEIERRVGSLFNPGELRASAIESGAVVIDGKYLYGHQYGDIWFNLNTDAKRDAAALIPLVKPVLQSITGTVGVWVEGDAPSHTGKPIKLMLSGVGGQELEAAIAELKRLLGSLPSVHDSKLTNVAGLPELQLHLDSAAIQRAGLNPDAVLRTVQLLADGESVARFTDQSEPVGVRVRAHNGNATDIAVFLRHTVTRADGSVVPLSQVLVAEQRIGPASIVHRDFQRIVTLQADIDKSQTDTLTINQQIKARWAAVSGRYPGVQVNFGGEIEAVNKGLSQLGQQFVLGIGLIFLIVGAQFKSYGLPCLVLLKVPMAFAGVVLGLLLSREPISLYTLYGAVALAGIAVNSAILLFSAAHDRLLGGMGVVHAAVYAARRRMLPILITSLTTLVGLLPLALAADRSATLWRPVATAIVWGVGFSTLLTLFIVPLLYRLAMGGARPKPQAAR